LKSQNKTGKDSAKRFLAFFIYFIVNFSASESHQWAKDTMDHKHTFSPRRGLLPIALQPLILAISYCMREVGRGGEQGYPVACDFLQCEYFCGQFRAI
jgi:hypothetical protein